LNWEMPVHGRWWAELSQPGLIKAVPAWVITQLESWKPIAEAIEKPFGKIEAELRAAAPRELIHGEGELTHELLARELIDPERFRNSRQVGNYFGLCPSESTSEQRRRLGALTKHGNPRLRGLLVEMAWRISRFQPNYRGLRRWGALLADRKVSVLPPARKPSSPWPGNWLSTSGASLPGECRRKNLGWSQECTPTEKHSRRRNFAEKKNSLATRRKLFGTAPPRHGR
jgi:hypothetical protein